MSFFEEHKDFVERYEKGKPPYDDISDEEALGVFSAIRLQSITYITGSLILSALL